MKGGIGPTGQSRAIWGKDIWGMRRSIVPLSCSFLWLSLEQIPGQLVCPYNLTGQLAFFVLFYFVFLSLQTLNVEETASITVVCYPPPILKRLVFQLKACWISLISLTQINLISLTLDGPTENCLILLLQCASAAAGKPAFFSVGLLTEMQTI